MYKRAPNPWLQFSVPYINNNVKTGISKYPQIKFNIYLTFENQ